MKPSQKFLAVASVAGISVLAACEKKNPPAQEKPAGESCPLCVSDFQGAAEPKASAQPLQTYAITLQDGDKISLENLIDHQERTLDAAYMNENFAGKRLAIYWGFPDCTSFCPPSTKAIMEALQSFKDAGIVPVFIASRTDPKTGQAYTPERMSEWMESFGGETIGGIALTGSPEILGKIYKQLSIIDPNGNHLPYLALVDEGGMFLGGAPAITKERERGRTVLHPAPQILIPAIAEKFGLPQPQNRAPQNRAAPSPP